MTWHDRTRRGVAAAASAALLLAVAPAAGAAADDKGSQGSWRVVLTARFGAASDQSGFDAVIAHRTDAWVFGGTNPGGGGAPVAEHWTGGRWRRTPLPPHLSSTITAASSASPQSIWAVGRLGGYVLNWSPAGWVKVKSGGWAAGSLFTGITAITKNDVWVFGAGSGHQPGAGTWNYFRGQWIHYAGPDSAIYQASALSASTIWAISGSRNTVLTYDAAATTWQPVGPAAALAGLRFSSVWAQSAHSVWLAGAIRQQGVLRAKLVHWNGVHWTRIAVPATARATGVTADGHGGIWVVANPARGPSALLDRSALGQWTTVKISNQTAGRILAVAIVPGTTAVWGAGTARAKTGRNAAVYEHGTAP